MLHGALYLMTFRHPGVFGQFQFDLDTALPYYSAELDAGVNFLRREGLLYQQSPNFGEHAVHPTIIDVTERVVAPKLRPSALDILRLAASEFWAASGLV